MPKYKLYDPDLKYQKKDNILFLNFYSDEHINIMKKYYNRTILYDCKEIFFNNLEKIKKISKLKINIISFDPDIQMIINKILNKKKEVIGILSDRKNIKIFSELEKIYDIDFSENCNYFIKKNIPLCIIDIKNTSEYNKLLENRITNNIQKTYIIHKDCENILYSLFINNYWDSNIDFINLYKNCCFSNKISNYLKNAICKKYELIEKMDGPLIYFIDFNKENYEKILNYNNIIFLIWIKIDPGYNINFLKKNNIFHFASTKNLLKQLNNYNVHPILFPLNIEVSNIFNPIQKKGTKILICDSQNYQNKLISILPDYEFLFSNKYDLNDPIIAKELYQKCFIVIRLSEYYGFLPMIGQLEAMNIPIVYNFSDYGLKWKTIEDVKSHILKYSPPIIKYEHQYSFDLMKDKIDNQNLEMIYNNLDEICKLIGKYNNIIFISNNDDKFIVNFFKNKNPFVNIDFIYLLGNNHDKKFQSIEKLTPDLIILKGDCDIDIYKYYNVPTIYLVDNLFYDNLDVPYWDNNCYKYINNNIIEKIKKYDISFVNSYHINDILKKYQLNCKLFYWNFIPYYRKDIIVNNNRKYDYGIVKSYNEINNIKLTFKNIIIDDISILYQNLHDIKYIIYEFNNNIFSQLRVDILMNGCKYNIPKYYIFRKQNTLFFKKGEEYLLKFDGCIITEKLEYGINFIEGVNDKEFVIYYYAEDNLEINEIEFIKKQKINNKIIGYNPIFLKNQDVEYLYYIYGSMNNHKILNKLGLSNIFNYYNNGLILKKFNVELLKRKWCYDLGKNGEKLDINDFSDFVLKFSNNIISKKCLIISKKINNYGGNQKTALQIIELLEKNFIVDIFSNNMNQKEYNFINDSLDTRIHNMKIIKKKKDEEIIYLINKNNYQFIINNKFNDYFKICDKITNPNLFVISHNSMDPFNELIINNQQYIKKVLTINKFHQNVLVHHGLKIPQGIYYNYVEKENYEVKRKNFKNRILFIGRFTKEKNLDLLIACMKFIKEIELVIIGGEKYIEEENNNIIWKGILQKDDIINELRQCDYLIVPSITEGLPFVILEAMNIGIPCIYSQIIGSDELIGKDGERGFIFELAGYDKFKMKMDWTVFKEIDLHFDENIFNILNCIKKAYNIKISNWNNMSKNCKEFIRQKYLENITSKKNLKSFEIIL
jgi:hypothetical protein